MSGPPLFHAPGEGTPNGAFGLTRRFRVLPEATGGTLSLWEEAVPEGFGPPLHLHPDQHEVFTLLSGRLRFVAGAHDQTLLPGSTVTIPPGVAHSFKGLAAEGSVALVLLTPGGGAGFFEAVLDQGLEAPRDMAAIKALAAEFGIHFVGPPLD